MGTSQSSSGPGSGIPMVPPWVPVIDPTGPAHPPVGIPPGGIPASDPIGPPQNSPESPNANPSDGRQTPPASPPEVVLAPIGRFQAARRNLGTFARSGSADHMHRAVGHYVNKGYGGAKKAVARFGSTSKTAGQLYSALSIGGPGLSPLPGGQIDRALLASRSTDEIMNAVVEATRPVDGTQDAEAERAAVKDALCELLSRYPGADMLALTEEEKAYTIERFIGSDVYQRFALDLGDSIIAKAPSIATGLSRMKEVKDYITETVAAAFRANRGSVQQMSSGQVQAIAQQALRDAFDIFEGYAI